MHMISNVPIPSNIKNPRTASNPVPFGDFFYFLSKLNRYLRAILQGIHHSVIVIYGNFINHSVPQLFVKLDGRCFKFPLLERSFTIYVEILCIVLLTSLRHCVTIKAPRQRKVPPSCPPPSTNTKCTSTHPPAAAAARTSAPTSTP